MRWFDAGQETVWHAIVRSDPDSLRPRYNLRDLVASFCFHARAWWGGVGATMLAVIAALCLQGPETLVTTSLLAEAPAAAAPGKADTPASLALISTAINTLGTTAARLSVIRGAGWGLLFPDLSPDRASDANIALRRFDQHHLVQRDESGRGLIVSVWYRDAKLAASLNRALVATVLDQQSSGTEAGATADPTNVEARRAVLASRTHLVSELDGADRRAAVLSQTLTDLARDMVAALRATDNRSASTEVSDQGAALLAELELKRVQLASKYQAGYPALVALDGEIAKLRGVVAGEQKRSSVVRSAANPVFAALAAERRRVSGELDALNTRRAGLHNQVEATDRRLAAIVPPASPPHLAAGDPVISLGSDPRFLSLPLLLLAGLCGTIALQWKLLRDRQQLVTPTEVELALGLPVLRCLDKNGALIRTLERPKLLLLGPRTPPG